MKPWGVLRLSLAALLAAALSLSSATLATEQGPVESSYSAVSAAMLGEMDEAKGKPVESVLLADESAFDSPNFVNLLPKLKDLGGGLYTGSLTAAEATSLKTVRGLSIDVNRPASTLPVEKVDPKWEVPNLLWDSAATIRDTDPALESAREASGADGTGVMVAVLDTGVDPQALGLGGDKVVKRVDFTTAPTDGSCTDQGHLDPYGHGTHVASIIAGAIDQRNTAIEGVAPGAKIVDLRVLDCSGSGSFSSIDQALQWILDNRSTYPIKVVNMSLGASDGPQDGLDPTSILINRLVANGVFVAVAAGNGYAPKNNLFVPAVAEFATTVASATVNKYGKFLAQYSSHGPTSDGRPGIDLTAPGSGIRAALTTATASFNNYETTMSGTSMATPYVAGIAALLLDKDPTLLPSGTVCDLSETCPSGVVKASMSNPLQDQMLVSDWFEPGVDPASGAGMVSASASLNQAQPSPSKFVRASFAGASDNVIQIPPHASPHTMSILLDTSFRVDMWERVNFNVFAVDSTYKQDSLNVVCTLLSETTCLFGEGGWTPRLFTYYLPPSNETTIFVVKSPKDLTFTMNIDSYSGDVSLNSGVKVSSLNLDGQASGTVTLERTADSTSATSYSVFATGGLGVSDSIELPAGPAGTSATLMVTASPNSDSSLDRIVFSSPNGSLLAASVRNRIDGDGPLIFPNPNGFDDSDESSPVYIADDGSILSSSSSTGTANPSGYASPYRVSAGSRMVSKYEIQQASSSQIDTLGYSQDGSSGLFRQYPAGSGIVAGDDANNWTYFVRNLQTGASYEVGPDWSNWSQWYLAPNLPVVLNENGTAAAWAVMYPTGDRPNQLVRQTGPGLSIKTVLDSFSSASTLTLYGYSAGKVLVRVFEPGVVDQLRLYSGAGVYQVLPQSEIQVMSAVFSANGQAVLFANQNTEEFRCTVGGVTKQFPVPTQLGSSFPGLFRVADDCSWMITVWDISPGWPRGKNGLQLIRVQSDGSVTRLDVASNSGVAWLSNLAGTVFLRSTTKQLEPGDLNGVNELYRGLGQAAETTVRLKAKPVIAWNLSSETLKFGESMALSASIGEYDAPITFRMVGGQCLIENGRIYAQAGLGSCIFEAVVAEDQNFLETTSLKSIQLAKASRPIGVVTLTADTSVEISSAINFNFVNNADDPYNFQISGPCEWNGGQLIARGVGVCTLTAIKYENENYLESRIEARVNIVKKVWANTEFSITAPTTGLVGEKVNIALVNSTGTSPIFSARGGCAVLGLVITLVDSSSPCEVSAAIPESENYAAVTRTLTIQVSEPTTVSSAVLDADWSTTKVLPRGSRLTFNARVSVVSGNCTANANTLTAAASSGTCFIRVGGYTSGSTVYTSKSFTIKLGPSTQIWTLALPTYSTKKIPLAKFTFITNGQPKTNLGVAGSFVTSSGCKVIKSGKTVAVDMGKLKKCVVTLRASAGFRVPALTKTWTFTR